MKEKLIKFVKLFPEIWSVPVGILLWIVSPTLIRMYDPTAGAYDSGLLQLIIYAIVAVLIFNGVAFLGIKFNFPVVYEWYSDFAGQDFEKLTSWQKSLLLVLLFSLYMLSLVLLSKVI